MCEDVALPQAVYRDTSAQRCFLSRKQRLGILMRSFNGKSSRKEDS